jgi:hypothetical protein
MTGKRHACVLARSVPTIDRIEDAEFESSQAAENWLKTAARRFPAAKVGQVWLGVGWLARRLKFW